MTLRVASAALLALALGTAAAPAHAQERTFRLWGYELVAPNAPARTDALVTGSVAAPVETAASALPAPRAHRGAHHARVEQPAR
ncbi:hypothetical protein [Methylobacterium sp. JK268]